MSLYQEQIQASAKSYSPEIHGIEQNGHEIQPSAVSGSEDHEYDWADVLKELEPYY